jgi:hypothetical protein
MFEDSIAVKQEILETQLETIVRMAEVIAESIEHGGKLLLCGNGGSAADAQHLAAELLVRLRPHVNRDGIPLWLWPLICRRLLLVVMTIRLRLTMSVWCRLWEGREIS